MPGGDDIRRHAVYVVARCVACKQRRNIMWGEVPAGSHPMCDACGSPMVPEKIVRMSDAEERAWRTANDSANRKGNDDVR